MLSIVIPSKNERFLQRTIQDVLEKAHGDVEIFPVLDGYNIPNNECVNDVRVKYIQLPPSPHSQKRHAINMVVRDHARCEYVMSLDAHCMMAPGFDVQLAKDHQPNWVQIPRRNRLDPIAWSLQPQVDERPPIDYEYIMWNPLFLEGKIRGFKWDARTHARAHTMIDDTLQFQGSCWLMTRDWFLSRGFMDTKYQGWGQEAEEIAFETRKAGGRVITNKNTWYAHLHKGPTFGRMYTLSKAENDRSYAYSYNRWAIEHKELFIDTIDKFAPLPEWPANWKDLLWTH